MALGDTALTILLALFLVVGVIHGDDTDQHSEDEHHTEDCSAYCKQYISTIPPQSRSAFQAAFKDNVLAEKSTRIQYAETHLNIGGHWDEEKSVFQCKIPGVYVFHLNILKSSNCQTTQAFIGKNRVFNEVSAYATSLEDGYDSGSATTILELEEGDIVYTSLMPSSCLFGTDYRYTHFSGFLLYADA
ncbi:complement C1q-like protein 3 [Ptychodera flava]|uniref:complement C1q-like protein 3 n=1 Tax=Ptychodera flava TaxID=63121 RepID=UPI003969F0B7